MYTTVHKRASQSRSTGRSDDNTGAGTTTGSNGIRISAKGRGRRNRFDIDTHPPRWMSVLMLVFFFLVGMGVYRLFHPPSQTADFMITFNTTEPEEDPIPDFPDGDPLEFEFDYEKLERELAEEEALDKEPIVIEQDENGEFILPEGITKDDIFHTKVMEVAEMGNFEEQNLYLTLLIMTDVLIQHMPICIFTERVLLISNVASHSEYTDSNYKAFGVLLDEYQDRGLDILAFPCNEFDNAEPGTDDDILKMVNEKYSPRLFVMAKMLRGIADNDLFRWLRARTPEDDFYGRGPILENFRYALFSMFNEYRYYYS